MKLYLSDLKLIGMHTFPDSRDFCIFIVNTSTAVTDFLLIRSILEENNYGKLCNDNVIDLENGYHQINTNFRYNYYLNIR